MQQLQAIAVRLGSIVLAQDGAGESGAGDDPGMTWWDMVLSVWERAFEIAGQPVTIGQVIQAVLLALVGIAISAWLTRRLRRRLTRLKRIDEGVAAAIQKLVFYVLVVIVVLIALQMVHFPIGVFTFLGGAVAIGLGFGAQNIFNNFISGLILTFERPVRIGDLVEVDDHLGRVEEIGGRCTRIKRTDGIDVLVPNSALLENNVINWTLSDKLIRTSVTVGIAYGSPTRQAGEIIKRTAIEHEDILESPEPIVLFLDFGDNALTFKVYFWANVSSQMQLRIIESDLRYRIDDEFRKAGITIAFPQRDVHLDTLSPVQVQLVGQGELPRES